MLPAEGLVEISRWQFAFTTMYHFINVMWMETEEMRETQDDS